MARLTPAEQRRFELSQYLDRQRPARAMTYEEFLAARGAGNPYAQAPQSTPDYGEMMSKMAQSKGEDLLQNSLFSSAATEGASSVGAAGGTTFASGTTVAGQAVGTAANGGTLMSTGVVVPAAEGVPVSSVGAAAPSMGAFNLSGIGSAGNAYLPIAGAIGAYDVLANDRGPVRGALQGAASGAAIGSYFGVPGAIIGGGIGGAVGLGKGLTEHESTREVAQKHNKELLGKYTDDPAYQAYVRGMREQYGKKGGSLDPSKPYAAGKYRTWSEYEKAGLDPNDLTGVYGNIKTFGKDWTKLNFEQQKAVTQGIIDAGLYKSKKGEVEITDPQKAQQIFNEVSMAGFKLPQKKQGMQSTMVGQDSINIPGLSPEARKQLGQTTVNYPLDPKMTDIAMEAFKKPQRTFGGGFFRDRSQETDHMGNFQSGKQKQPAPRAGLPGIQLAVDPGFQVDPGMMVDPGRYPMQQGQAWQPAQIGTYNPALEQRVNFAPSTQERIRARVAELNGGQQQVDPTLAAPVREMKIPRSKTRSPGIGLDGKRINYGRR